MIAANEAVARELEAAELTAVYRAIEKPAGERLHSLNETLGKFGYFIADIENITPKISTYNRRFCRKKSQYDSA